MVTDLFSLFYMSIFDRSQSLDIIRKLFDSHVTNFETHEKMDVF